MTITEELESGWVLFTTLGEMSTRDIVNECHVDSWAPVLVVRDGDKTCVPVLNTHQHAIRFAQRNLPKNQLFGTLLLTAEDAIKLEKEFTAKGFTFVFLDHPKKMAGTPDVEIYEFAGKPDVLGVKKDMTSVALAKS